MGLEFNSPMNLEAPLKMRRQPLRAEDNLSYLQFIALVRKLWEDSHPDIPFKPVQSATYAQFPVMVYSLELRKPNANEPKMRLREQIVTDGDVNYIVQGQRFENLIIFSALTQNDPETAEQIIEAFEDFMLEYTPVFKRLGVSEILYSRRTPDNEQSRFAEDIDKRSVAYLVVTEKVRATEIAKIEEIILNVRQFLSTNTVDGDV